MEKLKLKGLGIEITRKCNKTCSHCMKGDSQNISLSKEIVDKLFSDIQDCNEFMFLGGEPLLELDTIEYIVDKVIENNWNVSTIQLTTNGTVMDERICHIYKKFCESGDYKFALLRISNDTFHDFNSSERAIDFYRPIINNINKEIGREAITLRTVFENKSDNYDYILYSGKAVNYINKHKNQFVPLGTMRVKCPDLFDHRIKIVNNEVFCRLRIAANGNIGFDEERSFELDDKMSFGNIMDSDVNSLIIKHNENCLLRCEETTDINTFESTSDFVPNINSDSRIYFKIVGKILKKYHLSRIIAKERFEYVPAQDIISVIPFPIVSDKKLPNLVEKLYVKYKGQPMNPFSYTSALKYVLSLVENEDIYFFPDYNFGTLDDLYNSLSFKKLEQLNDKYKNGELEYNNSRVFKCEDE